MRYVKRLVVDNSSLTKLRCPRMYYYAHVLGRVPAVPSIHLEFGRAFHEALALRYKLAGVEEPGPSALEAIRLAVKQARLPDVDADPRHGKGALLSVVEEYLEAYKTEKDWKEVLCVERSFELPLGTISNTEVCYAGRIDLVVRRRDDTVWVVDHKTTAFFGDTITAGWEMDGAFLGYIWATVNLGLAEKVSGFVVNSVRTNGSREFRRYTYTVHPETVEEWKKNTLELCRSLLRHYSSRYWPMQRACCVGRYGECEYRTVCSAVPSVRNEILNSSHFEENTWTP